MTERGSASVLVVALVGVLLLLGLASAHLTATAAGHRRAQAAADLAALAGAQELQRGRDPCVTAASIAAHHDAALAQCRREGADVVVEVTLPGPVFLGHGVELAGRARAGPG